MTTPPPQVIPLGKIVVQADAIVPSIGGIATTIPAISAGNLLAENMKTNTIMTGSLGIMPIDLKSGTPIGQITTIVGSSDIQVENANLRVDSTTASTGNNDGSFSAAGGADFQKMTYFHGGATDQNGNAIIGTNVISNYQTAFNGVWATPSAVQTLPAAIEGSRVTLTIPGVTAAYNAPGNFTTSTALPSSLIPSTAQYCPFYVIDNGVVIMGLLVNGPKGLVISSLVNGGSFTAGTCGWPGQTITYRLI